MANDGGPAAGFLLACAVLIGFGMWAGQTMERRAWEARLVDQPGQVAAIRSRVLAERAEAAQGE